MSRNDFMKQLEHLLGNLPSAEREAALQYYNDYFDDAGAENEKEVIEALGNPARVAENIKRDLNGMSEAERTKNANRALVRYGDATGNGKDASGEKGKETTSEKISLPVWVTVLLLIFGFPFLLAIGCLILSVAIAVAAAYFTVIFSFGAAAVVLLVNLVALVIVGFMCMPLDGVVGVGVIGCGLICGGLGLLCFMLTLAIVGIATPAIWRGIRGLFRKKTKKPAQND